MGTSPKLSVLVCTKDRPEKATRAIASILDAIEGLQAEVVIIDQSSDERTRSTLDRVDDCRIRYCAHRNRPLASARNLSIRLARGSLLAFTDDDCIVDPSWARALFAELEEDHDLAAVFGQTLAHDHDGGGRVEYVSHESPFGMSTHAVLDGRWFCHSLTVCDRRTDRSAPCTPSENIGSSNNFAVRRSVFAPGLFAGRLGAGTWVGGGEDTELIYRWLRQGLILRYLPTAVVRHDSWVTAEEERVLLARYATAAVAVFGYYAVSGDSFAREVLRYRLGGLSPRRQAMYLREPQRRAFVRGLTGAALLRAMGLQVGRLDRPFVAAADS